MPREFLRFIQQKLVVLFCFRKSGKEKKEKQKREDEPSMLYYLQWISNKSRFITAFAEQMEPYCQYWECNEQWC
jgi:hypothetical protein